MESEAKIKAKELAAQAGSNYLIFIDINGNRHIEKDITTEAFIDFVITAYKCFNIPARIFTTIALKIYFNDIKR